MTTTAIAETNRIAALEETKEEVQPGLEPRSKEGRLNIALDLDLIKHLEPSVYEAVLWFHQYALNENYTYKDCEDALNYSRSTVFRVLKGHYNGDWMAIRDTINSFKKLILLRSKIQKNEFVKTQFSEMIWAGLNYASANSSICLIIGESRTGKSMATAEWAKANNHGRTVLIEAPVLCSPRELLRSICGANGANRGESATRLLESCFKAFNQNRNLIVDEAHCLLPKNKKADPVCLEVLRRIHDRTGCMLTLVATERFSTEVTRGDYQYEQVLGRIGMPIRLPEVIKSADVLKILRQYVKTPSEKLLKLCTEKANQPGRLGILSETLKFSSQIASNEGKAIHENHIFEAFGMRRAMSGDLKKALFSHDRPTGK